MNGFLHAARAKRVVSMICLMCFASAVDAGQSPRSEAKPLAAPKASPSATATDSNGPKSVTVARPVVAPFVPHSPEYLKSLYVRYDAVRAYETGDKRRESEQWDESFKAYAKARELYESIGEFDDAKESAWSLRVGRVEQARGNFDSARDHYQAAIESDFRRTGEPSSAALVALGYLEYALRRYEVAEKPLTAAVAIDRRTKIPNDLSFSLQWLAAVRRAQGDDRQAAALFREASDTLRAHDKAAPAARAEPLCRLSRVLLKLGELPEALATAEEAASLFEQSLGAAAKETIAERQHVAQIAKRLGDQEQRRHLPQEFSRLHARFLELSAADRGKKEFYREPSWWDVFDSERKKPAADDHDPPFPHDAGWVTDIVAFRARLRQAALDVAHVHDLDDSSLRNLREVLAVLEVIDGDNRAALEHIRAAHASKARSPADDLRILNVLAGMEGYFGNEAAMLDHTDELYAYSHRYDADYANFTRARAATFCRDPALRERCQRYLELARAAVNKTHGADHWKAAYVCELFAEHYILHQDPRGIAEAERMLEIVRRKLPADAPFLKYLEFTRADAYLKCGEPKKAEPMLETLLLKFRAEQDPDRKCIASLLRRLARLDAQQGRNDSARRRYDEAIALLKDQRHARYRLQLFTHERDDFLAGNLTPPAACDPPEPLEEPRSPSVTAGR